MEHTLNRQSYFREKKLKLKIWLMNFQLKRQERIRIYQHYQTKLSTLSRYISYLSLLMLIIMLCSLFTNSGLISLISLVVAPIVYMINFLVVILDIRSRFRKYRKENAAKNP